MKMTVKLNGLIPGLSFMKGDYSIPAFSSTLDTSAIGQDGAKQFLVITDNAGEEEIPPETEIRVDLDEQQNPFISPELEDMCPDLIYFPTPLPLNYTVTVPQPMVDAEDANAPPLKDFRHFSKLSGKAWGELRSNETMIVQTETRVLRSTAVDTETKKLAANTCELYTGVEAATEAVGASTSVMRSRAAKVRNRSEMVVSLDRIFKMHRRRKRNYMRKRKLQEPIIPTCHETVFDDGYHANPSQYAQMPYFADPDDQHLG